MKNALLSLALLVAPATTSMLPEAVPVLLSSGDRKIGIKILDVDASGRRSRVIHEMRAGISTRINLPKGRYVVVCSSPNGDAAGVPLRVATQSEAMVRCPQPKSGRGVLLLRMNRSRAVAPADLTTIQLESEDRRFPRLRSSLLDDVAVFSGVPKGVGLSLVLPGHRCLTTPMRLRLETPWAFRDAGIGLCSDLNVNIDGFVPRSDQPVSIALREGEGDPNGAGITGKVLAVKQLESTGAHFSSLSAGTYFVQATLPALRLMLSEKVFLAAESWQEYSLALRVIRMSGRASFRGHDAVGVLRFETQTELGRRTVFGEVKADGRYEVTLPAAGFYLVRLLSSDDSQVGPETQHLVPDVDEFSLDLVFRSARVSGRVRDKNGRPVDGAIVQAYVIENTGQTTDTVLADMDGSFEFPNLPAGQCEVSASKPGYRFVHAPPPLILTDADDSAVDLQLERGSHAEITVLSTGGSPQANVKIFCATFGSQAWELLGTTGGDGKTDVAISDGAPLTCFLPNPVGAISHFTLARPEPVTWKLNPAGGRLVVQVRDEADHPVSGKVVLLRSEGDFIPFLPLFVHDSMRGASPVLDGAGIAVIEDAPAGWIEIYLANNLADQAALTDALNGSDLGRAAEFALEPGDQRSISLTIK